MLHPSLLRAATDALPFGWGVHRIVLDTLAFYFCTTSTGRRVAGICLPEGLHEAETVAYLYELLEEAEPAPAPLRVVMGDVTTRSTGAAVAGRPSLALLPPTRPQCA